MTPAKNTQLPYLEDIGIVVKKLYTPEEWTERIRTTSKQPKISRSDKYYPEIQYPLVRDGTTREPEIRQALI